MLNGNHMSTTWPPCPTLSAEALAKEDAPCPMLYHVSPAFSKWSEETQALHWAGGQGWEKGSRSERAYKDERKAVEERRTERAYKDERKAVEVGARQNHIPWIFNSNNVCVAFMHWFRRLWYSDACLINALKQISGNDVCLTDLNSKEDPGRKIPDCGISQSFNDFGLRF
jgi:hypothetical protein